MYENKPLYELAKEAETFAQRYNTTVEGIPEATKRLEGPDFGMFAAITGFNKDSYRNERK
ncbi:hypothetical protein HQ545_07620 [Candidatus Woesearchaeota archaeon]|nr:hypothetical protein [Candidatus Woesearchaeota archaeon]